MLKISMKINKILVALSFFMVILCQIASARNIIERDMGANKGLSLILIVTLLPKT